VRSIGATFDHGLVKFISAVVKLRITTVEAARRLGVTPSRVRALIEAKRLKAFKYGREWLIDPKDLAAVKTRKVGRPRKSRKTPK